MSYSDVFTDVPWANDDYITVQKMQQMAANDRFLRDEASHVRLYFAQRMRPEQSYSFGTEVVNQKDEVILDVTLIGMYLKRDAA